MNKQEQIIYQDIKDFIMSKCVAIIDKNTNVSIKGAITKDHIMIALHDNISDFLQLDITKRNELVNNVISELIESEYMIDGKYPWFYKYN